MKPIRLAGCALLALLALAGDAGAVPLIEYTFDTATSGIATNTGTLGAANNGTIVGAAYSTDTRTGAGFALDLDGTQDYISVPGFSYGTYVTVEAWIRPDTLVTGENASFMVIWDDYGNPGVLLGISGGQLQMSVSTASHPGGGATAVGGTIATGVWQHVAGVYDGASVRAYIDGCLVATTAGVSGAIIDNPAGNTTGGIGAVGADGAQPFLLEFNGRIDDFRIHNSVEIPVGPCADVPEPASVALAAAGAIALAARRARRA